MLAAIGVIIIGKQTHTLLGVTPKSHEPIGLIAENPHSLWHMNPFVAFIGFLSLLLLFGMTLVKNKTVRKIPVQMLVMVIAIPLGMYFELGRPHTYSFGGTEHSISDKALVNIHLISCRPSRSLILNPSGPCCLEVDSHVRLDWQFGIDF